MQQATCTILLLARATLRDRQDAMDEASCITTLRDGVGGTYAR